jgi:deoxyribodipyrimidine photo-lyase
MARLAATMSTSAEARFLSERPVIVWFRLDLRVVDNPALSAAAHESSSVLPVYILDDSADDGPLGGAGRWWLHHSLAALESRLSALGAPLVLLRGNAEQEVAGLVRRTGARAVYWNRRYEPRAIARDRAVKARFSDDGIVARSFNASLLFEPWTVATASGDWYKVFTPFWKACLARPEPERPLPAPDRLNGFEAAPGGERLVDWRLLPEEPDWAAGFRDAWRPGEQGANDALERFLLEKLSGYEALRDIPGAEATSCLSPYLHWGEIGPRQVWHAVMSRLHTANAIAPEGAAWKYLAELGWREFSYHLLYHFPDLPRHNFRPAFDDFPWGGDDRLYRAWTRGQTGFPVVDAGMRQLWATGWIHNRVRMVAASFLVKDLLADWRRGMHWFEDTLVDADLASNAASWQWVAGSGADAAPYFRIFNPVLQGEKFDPDGSYVRRWIPELAQLPDRWIHRPWEAPEAVREAAGLRLSQDYPLPCVDHAEARRRALAAFERVKAA